MQISDLHIKEDFTYKNLDKVVKKVNTLTPDIILFTGDLYDNYASYHDDENIISELQKLEANYDKIAIWGNRDYGGGAVRQYEAVMEQAGFTVLQNENWYVTLENDKSILFTGLDDSLLGNPSMPDSTKIYDSDYDILLVHEPDIAGDYFNYNYNLTLSGHSHGGQVDIPFLPALNENAVSATALASEYSGGMYTIDSDTDAQLYVNTGIGTAHISARFGVVPEKDGLETCRELRQLNVPVKIIMLTASTTSESELQGLTSGADDYIKKPFDIKVLLVRIKKLCNMENVLTYKDISLN